MGWVVNIFYLTPASGQAKVHGASTVGAVSWSLLIRCRPRVLSAPVSCRPPCPVGPRVLSPRALSASCPATQITYSSSSLSGVAFVASPCGSHRLMENWAVWSHRLDYHDLRIEPSHRYYKRDRVAISVACSNVAWPSLAIISVWFAGPDLHWEGELHRLCFHFPFAFSTIASCFIRRWYKACIYLIRGLSVFSGLLLDPQIN